MTTFTLEQIKNRQIQGDVILVPIDKIPETAKRLNTENKILQMSETSGHHHHFKPTAKVDVFIDGKEELDFTGFRTITQDDNKHILVYEEAELFHGKAFLPNPREAGTGDHKSQIIKPGAYKVLITREMDFDTEEAVRVRD